MSDVIAATDATGASSLTASSGRKDIRYEVLDMNSQGMYLCQLQQLDDAERLLTQAYSLLENDSVAANTSHQVLDQLRSTTLNNLGVVECHKGLHKQALNHLEVAQTLESQWNIHSPSVSLNICAACNALQMYDRATTAALDTIEMLRQAAKSDATRNAAAAATSPTKGDGSAGGDTAGGIQVNPSDGENSVLWGAAWHNLAVAQLNSATGKDISEYTNVLAIFDNAMKATRELLGWKHPMTKAVHDTYRSVRAHLREAGAFKQHHALLTAELAPITGKKPLPEAEPGMTVMATSRKHEKELHITLRGKDTAGKKVVERYNAAAFPGDSARGSVSPRSNSGRSGAPRHPSSPRGVGIPLSGNLLSASVLYRNPHPLLLHPRTENLVEYVPKGATGASPRRAPADGAADVAQPRKAPQLQQPPTHGVGKQSVRSGGGRAGDGLADDMWVEAVGHSSPRQPGQGVAGGSQRTQVRPLYSQQLYALDGSAPANEHRVAQPLSTAQLDAKAAGNTSDVAQPPTQ